MIQVEYMGDWCNKYQKVTVEQDKFGDGTLKCVIPNYDDIIHHTVENDYLFIHWFYDNDSELFTLISIVNQIRDNVDANLHFVLYMPYIPHARQDRNVSGRVFTLKYFAQVINSLNFDRVYVLDPHSDVSTAVIDRVVEKKRPIQNILDYRYLANDNELADIVKESVFMYPDAGAAKKYSANDSVIIGNKHRNTDGRIVSYELINFIPGTKKVIIVDDICSYGGTFVAAAKALKEKGVENIYLVVSHCEGNIFKGEVFDYVDKVITTDSILDLDNFDYEGADNSKINKIKFIQTFRKS